MSMELIAIIGIGVSVIGVCVTMATLILKGYGSLRAEMKEEFKYHREWTEGQFKYHREWTEAQFETQRKEMVALGKQVSYLTGLFEGQRDPAAAQRVALADVVAEEPGEYQKST